MSDPDQGRSRGQTVRRRRAVWTSAALLALAVVVIALSIGRSDGSEEGATVRVARARTGPITNRVLAQGKIRARRQVQVGSELSGRVVAVFVKEGATIKEGDPLFALDDEQAKNAVAQLEVARRAARANLTRAELTLAEVERAIARDEKLRARGAIPEEQLLASRAQKPLALANVEAMRAGVDRATLDLARARDTLAKTRVVAPLSGTVLDVGLEVGQVVFPATTSGAGAGALGGMSGLSAGATTSSLGGEIVIADLNDLVAELQVDELDIHLVQPGQLARIKTQGGRHPPWPGTVELTGLFGRESGGAVFFPVEVGIEIGDEDGADGGPDPVGPELVEGTPALPPLRPGMTVTAELEVEKLQNTVLIPLAAVLEGDNRPGGKSDRVFVVVEEGGRRIAQPREVTLGPSDGDTVAALAGLSSGDLVVEGPYRALRELKADDPVVIENEEDLDEAAPAAGTVGGAR